MQGKNKKTKPGTIYQHDYFPKSIKRIEERPDLNDYLKGKPATISKEPTVLKQSLAEHLANPYIYIQKVLNKNKARYHSYEHPEGWVPSSNLESLRRPRTREVNEAPRQSSPGLADSQSPGTSPKRFTTQAERNAHYEQNANQRNFVNYFFETIYHKVWENNQAQGIQEERPKGSVEGKTEEHVDPTNLKGLFSKYIKEQKLVFNKQEEGQFVDKKSFATFVKKLMGKNPQNSAGLKREGVSPTVQKQDEPQDEFDEQIDKFFKTFAEDKGKLPTPAMKISMKAFMYNYKKHIEKKHKILYILSEKAAKQRNVDIKLYIKNFLAEFDNIKANLAQIKEKEQNISSSIVAYDIAARPEGGQSLIELYNHLVDDKDQLLFDRKVIVRFLDLRNKRYPEALIELEDLTELMYSVLRDQKGQDLTLLGGFIHEFKREKQLFKEDQFTLFEMVNFIHEKKYTRAQFEILSHFISCLRKDYNSAKNLPKTGYVDPRTPFTNSFLSAVFDRLCKKAEKQSETIESLIRDLEQEYERYKGEEATARTNKIIEHNVLGDFILKRIAYLDNHLLEMLDKLEELGNYLTQGDVDQVPMEEVRRRVYWIITGQELRERPPVDENTKKLEGFKKLLKGASANNKEESVKRGEPQEKGGKVEKVTDVNKLLQEKERALNDKLREQEIQYEREREAKREKERVVQIEDYKKKQKADKDEWDWEAAITGGTANPRDSALRSSGISHAKDDKNAKEEDLDDFISLLNDKRPAEKEKNARMAESFVVNDDRNAQSIGFLTKGLRAADEFETPAEKDRRRVEELLRGEDKNAQNIGFLSKALRPTEEYATYAQNERRRPEEILRNDDKNAQSIGFLSKVLRPDSDEFLTSAQKEKRRLEEALRSEDIKNQSNGFVSKVGRPNALESDGFSRSPQKETMRSEDKRVMIHEPKEAPTFKSTFLDTLKSLKMLNEGSTVQKSRFESPEHEEQVKNSILRKNEQLSKTLENVQDANFLTKSTLKGRTDDAVILPDTVNLGKDKPKMGRYSDYEMLLPPDYYTFLAKKNVEMDKDPWYIRSHHIETLTEHPKSVKDNLLGAEYMSYYSALPKDEKVVAKEKEIVGYSDKENLIKSLEENRKRLKEELEMRKGQRDQHKMAMSGSDFKNSKGFKEVSKYYDTREVKEGPELMIKAYEGILDDLRAQERDLLVTKRTEKLQTMKPPPHKWWELKDKTFIDEYIKHVFMINSDVDRVEEYIQHVEELQLKELI